MPTFSLEDEPGRWLTDVRLSCRTGSPVTGYPRGRDTPEVVEAQDSNEPGHARR
jgi:hypothetical protein